MPVEDTDLERRVLAHEQILQALLAQLEDGSPGFLDDMRVRFGSTRRGAHEHDYVETADYAEAFLHEVMRLTRVRATRPASSAPSTSRPAVARTTGSQTVVIRTAQVGGVWRVTQDAVFLGDYLAEAPARQAATKAADEIVARGGLTELVFAAHP